jgi:hypothetical protein
MNRSDFERACREQNAEADKRRSDARKDSAPCVVVTMFAFGGIPYCQTHGVMGPCPYGTQRGSK